MTNRSTTPDKARRNRVEEQWNDFRKKALSQEYTRQELEDLKALFFSGAWALFNIFCEAGETLNQSVIAETEAELLAFMKTLEKRVVTEEALETRRE